MSGPKLQIAISVLPDGRVVFGDLPPELAEVAAILRGESQAPQLPDATPDTPTHPLPAEVDSPDGSSLV